MAWPENGTVDWNTEMLAFTGVEHDTDGTHDLSTIGWTETAVFTKDMTDANGATDTVSSLSFQPRLVIFFAAVASSKAASWGADDSSVAKVIFQRGDGTMTSVGSSSVRLETTAGSAIQEANVTSLSSSGFTITWIKTGTPTGTGTIIALCFK